MLLCWGGARKNGTHKYWLSPVSKEEAKNILRDGFRGQFEELGAMASELYDRLRP